MVLVPWGAPSSSSQSDMNDRSAAMKPPKSKSTTSPKPPLRVSSVSHQHLLVRKRSDLSIQSNSTKVSNTPSCAIHSVTVSSQVSNLSDLSGSCIGSGGRNSASSIPRHIYPPPPGSASGDQDGGDRPWRQAYILSTPPPATGETNQFGKQALIVVERGGDVELVRQDDELMEDHIGKAGLPPSGRRKRVNLVLVLMDPFRKLYELVQLWVDKRSDSVRDVLTTLRNGLHTWKQDYDGLIQVRQGKAAQWIHCLAIKQYDIQPFEVLIAKPWSMSAKTAGQYGSNLLDHLKTIGIVRAHAAPMTNNNYSPKKAQLDPTIPILSANAQQRIYAPDGIMKHHHAKQYLSFSPAFEPTPIFTPQFQDDDQSSLHTDGVSEQESINEILGLPSDPDFREELSEAGGGQESVMTFSQLVPSNAFGEIEVLEFGKIRVEEPQGGFDLSNILQAVIVTPEASEELEPPLRRSISLKKNGSRPQSPPQKDHSRNNADIPTATATTTDNKLRPLHMRVVSGDGSLSSFSAEDGNSNNNNCCTRRRGLFALIFRRNAGSKKQSSSSPESKRARTVNGSASFSTLDLATSRSDRSMEDHRSMEPNSIVKPSGEEETVVGDEVPLLRLKQSNKVSRCAAF